MSNGLFSDDRQSYKESKRRRRQAYIANKTGRILPYGTVRRKVIILVIILLFAAVLIGGTAFLISWLSTDEITDENTARTDSSQLLMVVNTASPLESDYVPELADCKGFKVNELAADSLNLMLSDAAENGVNLKIKSAYISYSEQSRLYEQTLKTYLENPDYTQVRAEAAAQKETALPGCSEAQTGLLIDFDLSDSQSKAFLERTCVSYGFILRYPDDKTSITRKAGSESLYRFTGKDNAVKMRAYNMCLEEYNNYLSAQGSGKIKK